MALKQIREIMIKPVSGTQIFQCALTFGPSLIGHRNGKKCRIMAPVRIDLIPLQGNIYKTVSGTKGRSNGIVMIPSSLAGVRLTPSGRDYRFHATGDISHKIRR